MPVDLWPPDLKTPASRTPVQILREQASLLTRKTNGLLEGEIVTITGDKGLIHRFNIVVIALGGYVYRLLSISHAADNLYPIAVLEPASNETTLNDEASLVEWLRQVLGSENTRRVVSILLAQIDPAA